MNKLLGLIILALLVSINSFALYKNEADQVVIIYAYSPETGNFVGGATDYISPPSYISKDGGSYEILDSTPEHIFAGFYKLTLTQEETNADVVAIQIFSTTPETLLWDPVIIYTRDTSRWDLDNVMIAGTVKTLDGLQNFIAEEVASTTDVAGIQAHGDTNWSTATGFSTHSAADVWTADNRALSTPDDYKANVSGLATSTDISNLQTHGDSNWSTATGFSTHDENDVVTAMLLSATDFRADVSLLDAAISTRAPASTALSSVNWTTTRAGYLDKLNVTGTLAHSDDADTYKATIDLSEIDMSEVDVVVSPATIYNATTEAYNEVGTFGALFQRILRALESR